MANEYDAEVIHAENGIISLKLPDQTVVSKNCTENVVKYAKLGPAKVSEKNGLVTFVKAPGSPQSHSQNTFQQSRGNVPANFQSGSNYSSEPQKPREDFREEAENVVVNNLNSAQKVAGIVGIENTTPQDLVAIGDMVGRTMTSLIMGAKKSR